MKTKYNYYTERCSKCGNTAQSKYFENAGTIKFFATKPIKEVLRKDCPKCRARNSYKNR